MAHPNADLLHRFYDAFAQRDAETMARCYHDRAVFSDPAFGTLDARQVRAMWKMLCGRSKDLSIVHSGIDADDRRGRAHWDARYTFGATGRSVLNRIDATFEFEDGLIVRHDDVFDFWRWSRQALGASGLLLGWSPVVRNKVRAGALEQLSKYLAANG